MTTTDMLERAIDHALGEPPLRLVRLGGGCVGDVARADLVSGRRVVVKSGDATSGLEIEGFMLRHLATNGLPVPEVLHAAPGLLIMEFIETAGGIDGDVEQHAADLLAALHGIEGSDFGFPRDTVIAQLLQPNAESSDWPMFFRDQRLMAMAGEANRVGRLPENLLTRIERLAGRLDRWITDPGPPSLIHGDLWSGNVLTHAGRVAGFIDPAIYHADAEIELAFTTLFATFGETFFARYGEHRPIKSGFFEERRDLYNLYPLLVHVRLFGGHYVTSVETTLEKFGC